MRSTRTIRTRVAHSLAQGRRQEQLDSVHVGTARWAVADGFGGMPSASARFVEMLAAEPEPIGRLTEEEARLHPRRATLNRALAAGLPSEPDVTGVTVRAGDRLVLTTDGVHAVLPDDVLAALLSAPAAASAVERVADAVRAAGEPDNHAIVAVDILP